jgi:carboxyl-terminal processing protease
MRQNQRLLEKQEPGSLKITIQKFYRVTGGSTQKLGVTPDIILPSFLEAFKNTESDLPHVLVWDEISPVRHYRHTNLRSFLPKLQEFYQNYADTNPEFLRYARDVREYIDFRENRKLPLEFQEARKYRDQETALARKWKHYQPERDGDKNERLHEADEAIYDDGAPREDVVLDASLAIMGEMMRIDQANDNNAFSIQRKKK